MANILDLISDVQRKLAGRTTIPALAPYWIRDAIRELTDNFQFTELEVTANFAYLTGGRSTYPVDYFTNNNEYPNKVVLFELFVDYPDNTVTALMNWREPAVVLPMSRIQAIPGAFTRVGYNFIFGSCPNSNFQVCLTYQKKHPIVGNTVDELGTQQIFMPDSWLEILVLSAAERGAMELRLPDYVTLYHQMLHGDPENPAIVGLLQARISQHAKDKSINAGQVVPVVGRY